MLGIKDVWDVPSSMDFGFVKREGAVRTFHHPAVQVVGAYRAYQIWIYTWRGQVHMVLSIGIVSNFTCFCVFSSYSHH